MTLSKNNTQALRRARKTESWSLAKASASFEEKKNSEEKEGEEVRWTSVRCLGLDRNIGDEDGST
jgi:hypothetical protein